MFDNVIETMIALGFPLKRESCFLHKIVASSSLPCHVVLLISITTVVHFIYSEALF